MTMMMTMKKMMMNLLQAPLCAPQATFMARLPALGLAVFHLYNMADSPMTLRSDTLLRLPGTGVSARAVDPLPVRSQQADPQPFFITTQSLTLGFSGTTGLLEVAASLALLATLATLAVCAPLAIFAALAPLVAFATLAV